MLLPILLAVARDGGGNPWRGSRPGAAVPGVVRPFLDAYCLDCHGPHKPKGDLDRVPIDDGKRGEGPATLGTGAGTFGGGRNAAGEGRSTPDGRGESGHDPVDPSVPKSGGAPPRRRSGTRARPSAQQCGIRSPSGTSPGGPSADPGVPGRSRKPEGLRQFRGVADHVAGTGKKYPRPPEGEPTRGVDPGRNRLRGAP